jgi:hypothetical protein
MYLKELGYRGVGWINVAEVKVQRHVFSTG